MLWLIKTSMSFSVICLCLGACSLAPSLGPSRAFSQEATAQSTLASRLELAGKNKEQLESAIKNAPETQRAAVEFLIANMPQRDLVSLSESFLLENVRLAYEARAKSPWKASVSDELFFSDVLPYANVDETRESWRSDMMKRCWPIVKDCKTPGEAAQALNKNLFRLVNVKYSTKRKKANQCPSESIEQGLASCTGLSILLVDACRSVNVPARLAGIPSWVNKRGNHTWVEVWDHDGWHFTGAAEYSSEGLDRTWFMGDAALADKSKRLNSIYAVSFRRTETTFPLVWSSDADNPIYAINVTDRYTPKAKEAKANQANKIKVRIRVWSAGKKERVVADVDVVANPVLVEQAYKGKSKSNTADMNDLLEFELNRNSRYDIRVKRGDQVLIDRFTTLDQETQLVEVELKK